jgi:U1 zinc finger
MTLLPVSECMPLAWSKVLFLFVVRKAHNSGRNHLANVRDYYACESYPRSILRLCPLIFIPLALGHDKAQSIIDQITSAYESGGGPPPGGFGFGPQHLTPTGPGFGGPPPGYGGPPGFGGLMPLATLPDLHVYRTS